jgi:hypothetical protein
MQEMGAASNRGSRGPSWGGRPAAGGGIILDGASDSGVDSAAETEPEDAEDASTGVETEEEEEGGGVRGQLARAAAAAAAARASHARQQGAARSRNPASPLSSSRARARSPSPAATQQQKQPAAAAYGSQLLQQQPVPRTLGQGGGGGGEQGGGSRTSYADSSASGSGMGGLWSRQQPSQKQQQPFTGGRPELDPSFALLPQRREGAPFLHTNALAATAVWQQQQMQQQEEPELPTAVPRPRRHQSDRRGAPPLPPPPPSHSLHRHERGDGGASSSSSSYRLCGLRGPQLVCLGVILALACALVFAGVAAWVESTAAPLPLAVFQREMSVQPWHEALPLRLVAPVLVVLAAATLGWQRCCSVNSASTSDAL